MCVALKRNGRHCVGSPAVFSWWMHGLFNVARIELPLGNATRR
ncbi:hypothetical protein R77591_03766 [Ralstonia mannitolilytica]|uniref:Uncharacterized protein n=1 Tax=Ralstonia mannitolilytica TaxID=105219 RepID=A0AAD2ELJ7_9RALS|nr:hypothetical protein R77591_03766 [Ralstonia mannitolilytica]CAJ0714661.1 hypothetical protein LMG8323_02660 [Ralstonia mannitolilytica]CAJ0798068.1 hypothetical protein LMG18090_03656 [Ralstonia mannitolilytica]CAJ0880294.1 hypothetical protein R77569_03157 [Ralstonia mannitolilytica]CAJ0881075.1 hypothetical protein R1479_02690 [Ralstonia mannitolilytica]